MGQREGGCGHPLVALGCNLTQGTAAMLLATQHPEAGLGSFLVTLGQPHPCFPGTCLLVTPRAQATQSATAQNAPAATIPATIPRNPGTAAGNVVMGASSYGAAGSAHDKNGHRFDQQLVGATPVARFGEQIQTMAPGRTVHVSATAPAAPAAVHTEHPRHS